MALLLKEVRDNPILWLLAVVPVVFAAKAIDPEAHTLLFVLSVLAIVPLATLLRQPPSRWQPGQAIPWAAC